VSSHSQWDESDHQDDGGSSVKEDLVMADKSGKEQKALHLVTIPITYATSEYMQQNCHA